MHHLYRQQRPDRRGDRRRDQAGQPGRRAVLSGNRNFEGRINPVVRFNYLASPPLVVAYAIAGTMDFDPEPRPARHRSAGAIRSTCATSGRRLRKLREAVASSIDSAMFRKEYGQVFEGDEQWRGLAFPRAICSTGRRIRSTSRRRRSSTASAPSRRKFADITGARALAVLGDSVTTDHISPAGSIAADRPAGKYLIAHGVEPRDFNSYGARRGNHEVMVRGTFRQHPAAQSDGARRRGRLHAHLPDGEQHDDLRGLRALPQRGRRVDRDRGQGVRLRLFARLGRQGNAAARRPGGDRGKLRTDPSQQPGRDGRAAARVHCPGRTANRSA